MKSRQIILALRFGGVAVLCAVLLAFWFRQELRDFMVDDTRYAAEIRAAAERHGLDPQLVRALVFQESRFDAFAKGRAGEIGLMQILPQGAVADWERVNGRSAPSAAALYEPAANLEIGCWYLAQGIRKYGHYRHGAELALARYNAGESRSEKWKPPHPDGTVVDRIGIASTQEYVTKIMKRYRKYRGEEK